MVIVNRKTAQLEWEKFAEEAGDVVVKQSSYNYTTKIDEVDASTTYVGEATPGTATSEAKWRIKKISVSGTVTTIAWAGGSRGFDQVWDNRVSLNYS